jgi:nitroreductase
MPKASLSENINDILSISRLAPSVHNTQPWRVQVFKDNLVIKLEPERKLNYGDPTGRQTYISIGIFAESCIVAMPLFGMQAKKVGVTEDGVVTIETAPSNKDSINNADAAALKNRFTDRSVYQKVLLSTKQKATIEKAWQPKTTEIKVSDEPHIINRCAELTRDGLLLALSSPEFRQELVEHLVPNNSSIGIPLNTLQGSRFLVRQLLSSGLSRRKEANLEYRRWTSASGLVFILSEGDTVPYWVESGRAYLRASLAIEKLGLAQATSAAIVEASDFHEDIEKLLSTKMRLQCLLRVGRSTSKRRPSGRLSPKELLAT